MKGLTKKIPEINFMKKSEKLLNRKGGIWTQQNNCAWFYKGLPVFDSEAEDYGDVPLSEVGVKNSMLSKMKIKSLC